MGLRDLFGSRATSTEDLIAQSQAARAQASPEDRIAQLARSGEKIMAIKLYREHTGVSLADAKDAIDAIARGESVGAQESAAPRPAVQAGAADADIRELLQAEQLIRAIKVYRERYGSGLAEAKDAVERIAQDMRSEQA